LGSLSALWNASSDSLRNVGFQDSAISSFLKIRSNVRMDEIVSKLRTIRQKGIRIIRFTDPTYPKLLRFLPTDRNGAPLVLFHRGSLTDFDRCVAIAGTRVLSLNGHIIARKFSRAIASAGYTVVSGLARGTDTDATGSGTRIEPRGGIVPLQPRSSAHPQGIGLAPAAAT
jgi:predicted Rossmann fold nucleotide-binding protein DprA/Smf involved in DNA uptake